MRLLFLGAPLVGLVACAATNTGGFLSSSSEAQDDVTDGPKQIEKGN